MIRYDLAAEPVWLAVISAGRPHAVAEYEDRVGRATWYVPPWEKQRYLDAGAFNVHPVDGLCAARNAALRAAFIRELPCVQMSDDIKGFIRAEEREDSTPLTHRYQRVEERLMTVVQDLQTTARETGARLVGVSATDSLIFYDHTKPTSLRNFILGDFMYITPSEPTFDERMELKEDYDFTAQHMVHYGIVARRNMWILKAQHRTNAGGAVARRTLALEEQTIAYLQNKWGTAIMASNPRKPGEILFRWPRKTSNVPSRVPSI